MNEKILDKIQGKTVGILELLLNNMNDEIGLSIKFSLYGEVIMIKFHNVSNINLKNISIPMEIHGFEIICNKQKGWEKDYHYKVHDFEDDCIDFFCENFECYIIEE